MGTALLVVALLAGVLQAEILHYPRVETPVGVILGVNQTIEDVTVEQFFRIPYAKPPVGELRFAPPQPFGQVHQTEAPEKTPMCPQPSLVGFPLNYSEDCLFLNVFRKSGTGAGDKKAVVVVIHGGGFSVGSPLDLFHNSLALAGLGDVIVVGMNYRLGILGFADMAGLAPGNLGFLDQRLALQWVQDNIAAFGGDPDRVSLIGVSAGAMSISGHLMSPLNRQGTKQLFHTVIMDAGVLSDGLVTDAETSLRRVKKVANATGCNTEDGQQMLSCLRQADVDVLLNLSYDPLSYSSAFTMMPTVDGHFLTEEVSGGIRRNAKDFVKVRTMIGFSADEGTMFASYGIDFSTKTFPNITDEEQFVEWAAKLASGFKLNLDFQSPSLRKSVIDLYYGRNPTKFQDASAFITDNLFGCPSNAFIEHYSKANSNVFVYRFNRKLKKAYWLMDPAVLGAFHGSPFMHMSGSILAMPQVLPDTSVDEEDRRYIHDAIRMVADFARSEEAPAFRGLKWPDFSKGEGVMVFDDESHITKGLNLDQTCDRLYPSTSTS